MRKESDLRASQQIAAEFIVKNRYCALWKDMGLGKTGSTLTALVRLMRMFETDKVLVIAPLRVARKVWSDEIATWEHTHGLKVSKIVGTQAQRLAAIEAEADVYTINNENLAWLVSLFVGQKKQLRAWLWDTVVVDEASCYKSNKALRFKAFKKVRPQMQRVITLTGTHGDLIGLWTQIWMLDRGQRLGKTITSFRQRWFTQDRNNQYIPKPNAEREILASISDIVLSMRAEDWIDMPELSYNPIRVDMTPAQHKAYRELAKKYVIELGGERITAANAAVLAGKLLQLANGAVYDKDKKHHVVHDQKIDALVELLRMATTPVIVCYSYKSDKERIERALTKHRIKFGDLSSVADEERFNAGKVPVLLIHPKSAGHGLNLQVSGAKWLVWFGLTWSLELFLQASARIAGGLRRGQGVVVHSIITESTIDERVMRTIQERDSSQNFRAKALSDARRANVTTDESNMAELVRQYAAELIQS